MRSGGHFGVRVRRVRARRLCAPPALLALLAVLVSPAAGETPPNVALTGDSNAVLAELVQDVGGRGASCEPSALRVSAQARRAPADGGGEPARHGQRRERDRLRGAPGSRDIARGGGVGRRLRDGRALGCRRGAARAGHDSHGDERPTAAANGRGIPPAGRAARCRGAPGDARDPDARSRTSATGSVLSQGDAAVHGPQARGFGVAGAGVRVGVISDSIDEVGAGIAGSQATGDLPADVAEPR